MQASRPGVVFPMLFTIVVVIGCIVVWDDSSPIESGMGHSNHTRAHFHFSHNKASLFNETAALAGVRSVVRRRGLATPLSDADAVARIRSMLSSSANVESSTETGSGKQRVDVDTGSSGIPTLGKDNSGPRWFLLAPARAIASHGCHHVHLEKLKPGGFGASMMRVVFGIRDHWLEKGLDYVIDTSLWSYRCANRSESWGCYFSTMLPCTEAMLPVMSGDRSHFEPAPAEPGGKVLQGLQTEWVRRQESPATTAADDGIGSTSHSHTATFGPTEIPNAATQVAAVRQLDSFAQLQWVASSLLRPTRDIAKHIDTRSIDLGFAPSDGEFLSLHFRRGDKVRESHSRPINGGDVAAFVKSKWGESVPKRIFVLTDDAGVLDELRSAVPEWDVRSFVSPTARGFNECLLPSVRKMRKGSCDCAQVAQKAKEGVYPSNAKQRSYCFVNPTEKDPAKLVSVVDTPVLDQESEGFNILTDITVATRSKYHVAVGCGSNVDKLIHLLRGGDPGTSVCISNSLLQECSVNVHKWSVTGIDCK